MTPSATMLDVLTVGESTESNEGIAWVDETRTNVAEVDRAAALLRRAPDASDHSRQRAKTIG